MERAPPVRGAEGLPAEWVNCAPVRPTVWRGDEGFSDGILADVFEFVAVVARRTEAVVEEAPLPEPIALFEMFAGKLAFPVGDPFFEGESEVARGAEEVEVVGHEEVIADEPSVSGAPDFGEGGVSFGGCKPGSGTRSADGEEDDGGLVPYLVMNNGLVKFIRIIQVKPA